MNLKTYYVKRNRNRSTGTVSCTIPKPILEALGLVKKDFSVVAWTFDSSNDTIAVKLLTEADIQSEIAAKKKILAEHEAKVKEAKSKAPKHTPEEIQRLIDRDLIPQQHEELSYEEICEISTGQQTYQSALANRTSKPKQNLNF